MTSYSYNLHLPYTCLVTKLRMSKRQVEIEITDILKEIINLKNNSQSKTKQEVVKQLQKSKNQLAMLKQKLNAEKEEQAEIYSACRKRVHLDKEATQKKQQLTKEEIMQEFNKQVVQFFACRNKIRQAQSIQKSLQDNCYFNLFVQLYNKAFQISEAITKNDLRPLKDWCYEHAHYLSKIKSSLQFKLISCSFINILNNKGGTKAIQFLRKQVATLSLGENEKEQLNKLTYRVICAEDENDYQYFSDSQKEKQKQEDRKKKGDKLKIQAQQKKQVENIKQNQPLNSSSSSSSNVDDALITTEAFVQVVEGSHGIVNRVINVAENMLSRQQKSPEKHLQPEPIQPSISKPQAEFHEMEEQYQDKFDSMSQEEGDYKIKKQSQGPFFNIFKDKQQLAKQQQSKLQLKMKMKQTIRKHKLDKNNLRAMLIETKAQFKQSFSKIYKLTFQPSFDKTLAVGISLLKGPSCQQQSHSNPSNILERYGHSYPYSCSGGCPTCTTQVNKIMQKIPPTQKNQSSFICRINGSLMNQMNYPVALPNGQIYSIQGLKVNQKNGKYHCLVEDRWFRKEACKKVFLS